MLCKLKGAGHCTSAKRMTSSLRHVAQAFPPARQGTILNSHRVIGIPTPSYMLHTCVDLYISPTSLPHSLLHAATVCIYSLPPHSRFSPSPHPRLHSSPYVWRFCTISLGFPINITERILVNQMNFVLLRYKVLKRTLSLTPIVLRYMRTGLALP